MTTARANANPRGMTHPSAVMFDTTISTERRTNVTSDSGGTSVSWAANLTGIPASVQPGTSNEAIQLGAERGKTTYDVYIEAGHDITSADRIVSGSDTLNVLSNRDMAGRGRVLHFVCSKTEGVASA
ncbi:MAG: phage head closure protein [Mycobacterium sp.]